MEASTKTRIQEFHLIHKWSVEQLRLLLDSPSDWARFVDSDQQQAGSGHFRHFLRLNLEPAGDPYVELHLVGEKELALEFEYRMALTTEAGEEIPDSGIDWTRKHLKSTRDKVDIFPGLDVKVDELKAKHATKLFIRCEMKYIAEQTVIEDLLEDFEYNSDL